LTLPKLQQNRLTDLIPFQLENNPKAECISDKVTGSWRKYSTSECKKIIDDLSLGLLNLGINQGDKIAVISKNRVEWTFIDLAVLQVGGILVPLYPNTSEDNFIFIFSYSSGFSVPPRFYGGFWSPP